MNTMLGFGTMRMPVLDPKDQTSFDYEKIEALFDRFLELGFVYFDTAYTYHGYQAEKAVKKALVERHERDSFLLATKLPLRDFTDAESLERIFNEQLENCGVTYFDYYLMHNMGHNVYEKCRRYDVFHFVKRKKEEGKIRNTGISFHDTPELLDKILEEYGDCFDFVQLQVNYADMDQPNVQAAKCLDVCEKYGKEVTVMEPCKGGTLIRIPEKASELFEKEAPGRSAAFQAYRFAASQKCVTRVLSGMNDMAQVEENCGIFNDFVPMTEEEQAVCRKAADIINSDTAVPCTACEYCTHGCPKHLAIPQYFAAYNSIRRTTGSFSSQAVYYNNTVLAGHGKASDCIKCGLCEKACPQHLKIRDYLEDVAKTFEGAGTLPTRK